MAPTVPNAFRKPGPIPPPGIVVSRNVNGPASEEVGDRSVSRVVLDVIIVLIIVSIGGFFASTEMALVSLREGQVRSLAKRGRRGARAARLAADPNRFLSAVQIGVTLATLVTGAFGADTLVGLLRSWMERQGLSSGVADPLAFAVVTVGITFVSLVFGELAPKRLGAAARGAAVAVRRADP